MELRLNGRVALDKVAGLASMPAQSNGIEVIGDADDVPVSRDLAER